MRRVRADKITAAVKKLCIDANYHLPEDVVDVLKKGYEKEESPLGRDILQQILKNIEVAKANKIPLCQDTGIAVFFIELGQKVQIVGGYLEDAINEGAVSYTHLTLPTN